MSKFVTATAKQTLHGVYGLANAGDTITLSEKHAKELEEKGLVENITDASEEEPKGKQGLSISDNTGKPKEKAEQDTDKENPTGKEKKEKAGPNAPKNKSK